MKKLEGSDISEIKSRIRKLVKNKLDMKDLRLGSLRQIIKGSRVPYVTALKWKDMITNQERLKRLRSRIIS